MAHMPHGLLGRWRVEPWVALRQQALYSVVGLALEVFAAVLDWKEFSSVFSLLSLHGPSWPSRLRIQ